MVLGDKTTLFITGNTVSPSRVYLFHKRHLVYLITIDNINMDAGRKLFRSIYCFSSRLHRRFSSTAFNQDALPKMSLWDEYQKTKQKVQGGFLSFWFTIFFVFFFLMVGT